jgi:hypothetical protein
LFLNKNAAYPTAYKRYDLFFPVILKKIATLNPSQFGKNATYQLIKPKDDSDIPPSNDTDALIFNLLTPFVELLDAQIKQLQDVHRLKACDHNQDLILFSNWKIFMMPHH